MKTFLNEKIQKTWKNYFCILFRTLRIYWDKKIMWPFLKGERGGVCMSLTGTGPISLFKQSIQNNIKYHRDHRSFKYGQNVSDRNIFVISEEKINKRYLLCIVIGIEVQAQKKLKKTGKTHVGCPRDQRVSAKWGPKSGPHLNPKTIVL